ncbi:uncharacterized protein PRCAT00001104001 [Priceomyces carsonii]|uniref:uncharacterized protein n=1 Tax=Priceomyces carsonii TaxID=28549 RepID=UPI002EDB11B1|nr:unnamed protein product [Priceomyces carsonii]
MDPFNEVQDDAYASVARLETLIGKSGNINDVKKIDFDNNFQELSEIFKDLEQALKASEADPESFLLTSIDIDDRRKRLKDLDTKIHQIKENWDAKMRNTNRDVTSMSNRISQDEQDENPFDDDNNYRSMDQFQQQQIIQEQDVHLDSIHETMRSLNQQAQLMGGELENQAGMLEDLDTELDNVGDRVQRGLKRIGYVIEKNREKASDWCIGILVVALCILLILVIAI